MTPLRRRALPILLVGFAGLFGAAAARRGIFHRTSSRVLAGQTAAYSSLLEQDEP